MSLPCKCLQCGFEFAQANLVGGTGTVTVTGGTTTCPNCGGRAKMLDGIFTFDNDHVTAVEGPLQTLLSANRLGIILKKAKSGDIEAEEIIAEIAGISPELAKKIISKGGLTVFGLILLLIWLIKSVQIDIKVDLNRLIDQASEQQNSYLSSEKPKIEDLPIPEDAIMKRPPRETIAAGPRPNQGNRKERRRQAALSKRRAKGES